MIYFMGQPVSTVITVFGRSGCHLCENVISELKPLENSMDFVIEEILIDNNPELEATYGQLIPVIQIDGKYHSHFRIDLEEFKSSLEKHRQHR